MEQPIGIKSKNYSLSIEYKIRNIFNCERYGMGGIADSDFINSAPYLCMVTSLIYIYKEKSSKIKDDIENFIRKYSFYSNDSIAKIITERGEQEFKDILEEYKEIINEK